MAKNNPDDKNLIPPEDDGFNALAGNDNVPMDDGFNAPAGNDNVPMDDGLNAPADDYNTPMDDGLNQPAGDGLSESAAYFGAPMDDGQISGGNGGDPLDGTYGGGNGPDRPISARKVRRGKVVNSDGEKIGKVRRRIWRDLDDNIIGEFRKDDDGGVYLYEYEGEERKGYLDKNDNVFTLSNAYMATLRRFRYIILIIILLILALITALSTILSVYYINRTADPIPTLFVVDEYGNDWDDVWADQEDLPVFNNSLFGPDKIAPGMTGSYAFRLRNDTASPLEFWLEFDCDNDYGIDLAFTLYRDGVLLAGGDEKVPATQLTTEEMTIEAESDSIFILEWEWRHNDAVDTIAGENGAVYTLYIDCEAWVQGS